MYCRTYSGVISGVQAFLCSIEVDIRNGLPSFQILGNVSSEVKDTKEKLRVAIENSDFLLPPKRITINISPSSVRKEGSVFELGMAMAVLAAFAYVPDEMEQFVFLGELALDGSVKEVEAVLACLFEAYKHGIRKAVIPLANYCEAVSSLDMTIYTVENLSQTVDIVNGISEKYLRKTIQLDRKQGNVLEVINDNRSYLSPFLDSIKSHTLEDKIKVTEEFRKAYISLALLIAVILKFNFYITGFRKEDISFIKERLSVLLPDLSVDDSLIMTSQKELVLKHRLEVLQERPEVVDFSANQNVFMAQGGGLFVNNAFGLKDSDKKLISTLNPGIIKFTSLTVCNCGKALTSGCMCTAKQKERMKIKQDFSGFEEYRLGLKDIEEEFSLVSVDEDTISDANLKEIEEVLELISPDLCEEKKKRLALIYAPVKLQNIL